MIRAVAVAACILLASLAYAWPDIQSVPATRTIGATGMPITPAATECLTLTVIGASCAAGGCNKGVVLGTFFHYDVARFANSPVPDESATWIFEVPDNIGTTAVVSIGWHSNSAACDGGATRDVCWTVDGDSFVDASAFETGTLDAALVAVTDNCAGDGELMVVALPTFTHSMVGGELGALVVARDADGGNCAGATDDDYVNQADLVSVRFCYEVDNVFSGE